MSPDGFRELRHSCFLSRQACAEFLGVTVRTVRHWDAGRCRVPWSVVRLLRLFRAGDVGGLHAKWHGWYLNPRTAELVSPNGYAFDPGALAAWTLVCEQARFWRRDYAQRSHGGVGAVAPARPEAVSLSVEAGEADRPRVHVSPAPEADPCQTGFWMYVSRVTDQIPQGLPVPALARAPVPWGLTMYTTSVSSQIGMAQPRRLQGMDVAPLWGQNGATLTAELDHAGRGLEVEP